MKVKDIPFADFINIQEEEQHLCLDQQEQLLNHLQTIHAGAQYTLAETQSGIYLQELFPHLADKVIPVLRDAQIKYKKPAQGKVFATASSSQEIQEKFLEQFERKGRASIEVSVEIRDINDVVNAQASFTWFVQVLNKEG